MAEALGDPCKLWMGDVSEHCIDFVRKIVYAVYRNIDNL